MNSQTVEYAKRFLTNESAQLEVYGRSGKVFCRMGNLSSSGAYFEVVNSTYTLKSTDLIRIKVHLRQINKTHTLHAEIIWSRGMGIGVRFLKFEDLITKLSLKEQT